MIPHIAPSAERRLAVWTLACALAVWLAMCGPFFAGRVYISDDLGAFHLPLRHFYAQCLQRGEPFDWCPQLYGGFYLSGEGQVGMYHPLHWLLYRFLSLDTAFSLELLLSYPMLLVGMYVFLRRHVPHRAAAMFGAAVFTFSGFNLLHFVHPNAIAIIAHIPWLLWAWGAVWANRTLTQQALPLAAIALLTASQILLGYPQYVWFSLLIEAAYAGLLWRENKPTLQVVAAVLAAKLLGLLASAVQWLPTWDLLTQSQRQTVDASFTDYGSLHPLNLVQLIAPYLFDTRVAGDNTHEFGLYIGAVPLLLIVWLLTTQRSQIAENRFLKFALFLAGIAFVLALGSRGGLYYLQTCLPVVGKFRIPARYLLLVHFGLAAAVAVALQQLLKSSAAEVPAFGSRTRLMKAGIQHPLTRWVAAGVLLAVLGPLVWPERTSTPLFVWTGPALAAIAAVAIALPLHQVHGACFALAALAMLDLAVYGLTYAVYPNTVRLADYLQAGNPPPLTTGFRIATELPDGQSLRNGNHLVVRGCRQIDGYAGLEPAKMLNYRETTALRLAGVQWVLDLPHTRTITGLIPRAGQWLEVPDPLPRVRLVGGAVLSRDPARDLSRIDPARVALVDQLVPLEPGDGGTAAITHDGPGRIQIDVFTPTRQLLVISESYQRGWRAQTNGQAVPLVRAYGDWMACVVEPGRHEVQLLFQPASLWLGRRLSLVGLAGIVSGFLFLKFACRTPAVQRVRREPPRQDSEPVDENNLSDVTALEVLTHE